MRERVMTDPKELVRIELKKAGFDGYVTIKKK